MKDHWFAAIYNNEVLQFKFHPQDSKKFSLNCWITTKAGDQLFVNADDMIFGEFDHLTRLINEKTIP